MNQREHVITDDPTVVSATTIGGNTHRGDIPVGNGYETLQIITPDGSEETITIGDEITTEHEEHGTVSRITKHTDDHETTTSQWFWTVYFDYRNGGNGGVPLGELATQLDEGASLE